MTKIYNYDDNGQFVGEGMADADPLDANNHLIPANATTVAPPDDVPGTTRHFVAGGWEFRDIPTPPAPEPEPQPDPLQVCKAQAKFLLQESDFAMLPDVNISNRAEFEAYRAAVRALCITPVAEPVWPVKPKTGWL